mmetsp:Transcript_4366/g.8743  ORF Transcript_4366/g.8743 Transcript_4366/m.8743 type:complete len:206 (+) Transcript_4366:66-683(+)
MTSSWTLYRPEGLSPEFTKIMLTAELCDIKLEVKQVDGVEKGLAGVGKEVITLPDGRFAVLQMPQGQLFGAQTISRFLAKSRPALGIHGETFHEQGEVDSWLEFLQNELEVAVSGMIHEAARAPEERRREVDEEAKRDIVAAFRVLDNHLHRNMYLVGHHPTLADVAAQAAMIHVKKLAPELLAPEQHRSLNRWFATLEAQRTSA